MEFYHSFQESRISPEEFKIQLSPNFYHINSVAIRYAYSLDMFDNSNLFYYY